MASTYSTRLKLELMEAGANAGVWGNNTNENLSRYQQFPVSSDVYCINYRNIDRL